MPVKNLYSQKSIYNYGTNTSSTTKRSRDSKIEENLWTTCGCKNLIYKEDMEANQKVCPKCGEHHKLTCKERFQTFFDNKEFELIETPLPQDDPLNFEDKKKYKDRLKAARALTVISPSDGEQSIIIKS